MKKYNTHAFTLVELIVVITILAILGTIGFMSFKNYTQSARNSSRISDMKTLEKAMSLLNTTGTLYPSPDESINITYSGGLAWQQGTFSSGAVAKLQRVSNVPVDPVFSTHYTYSLSGDGRTYQIAAAQEGDIAYTQNNLMSETYAINGDNLYGYVLGNRINHDTPIISGGDCSIIATPSIILSEIPLGGILLNNTIHNYSYNSSLHVPSSYSGLVTDLNSAPGFQTVEVLGSCSIDTIGDLELYLAKLSTAYISLSSFPKFEDLVFNSNSPKFQITAVENLKDYGIDVNQDVIDTLKSPDPDYVFTDTFTNTNGTNLVSAHIPGSGLWFVLGAGDSSAYNISGNILEKNGASNTIVGPTPNPLITNPNYTISFDIENFASGDISIYLRYTDSDNYYKLIVSSSGYQVMKREGGVDSIFQTILDPINTGDNVLFSVSGDSLVYELNGSEKENIVAGGINTQGKPGIMMQNNGAQIDNFTLTYK